MSRRSPDPSPAPLHALLRWIGAHVRGFHAAVGLFLILGMALALACVFAFAALARWVARGATQSADEAVLRWIEARHTPLLDTLALQATYLGATSVVTMTLLVASALLWTSRHRYSVVLLWTAVLGNALLNTALKSAFARPRPEVFPYRVAGIGESLASFPSGHAMSSVVVYGTLAYLVVRLEPTRRMRRVTVALAVLLVLAIGASRLYLGVHYPSDIVAGYAAGFAWATTCALGIEALRHFRGRRPGVAAAEADLERGLDPRRDALEPRRDGE
jgi:undecaprenyl-diphosphatase